MTNPPLDERSRDVLKSIIQLHIVHRRARGLGEPRPPWAGPLSSATLRNIMADLEKMGYLDHPHTSAGRQPTDEGYRVYVDSLMSLAPCPPVTPAAIDSRAPDAGRLADPGDGERPPICSRAIRARWASSSCRTSAAPRSAASTSCGSLSPHPRGDGVPDRARHQPHHRGRGGAHPGRPAGLRQLPEQRSSRASALDAIRARLLDADAARRRRSTTRC